MPGASGWDARGKGADDVGGLGFVGFCLWPPPGIGAVDGTATGKVVVVVVDVVVSWAPASISLTTSSRARTRAERSVTSAATTDVAVQTTAVDPTVATSHSPTANNRVRGTRPGCRRHTSPRAKGGLNPPGAVPQRSRQEGAIGPW